LTEDQINEAGGDPWRLQILINEVNDKPKPLPPQNFDQLVLEVQKSFDDYKSLIESNKHTYYPSDKKKLLALPFQMAKLQELPEPKRGQKEWTLFTELFDKEWDHFDNLVFDPEEKITEFNYEKFIPKQVLETMDTQSKDFKNMIKKMNLNSFTEYERHQNNKKAFKEIMPILSQLDEEEMRIFMHMIHSKNRELNAQAQNSKKLVDEACSDFQKQRLAKISEEQNLMNKNRFYLDKNVMKFADKKRMPIDELKVKDMLRNQHLVRQKIVDEVGTYREFFENTSFEQGVLTYVNEAAWGDMRDLLKDIGINRETVQYSNVSELVKAKDERKYESDINFKNLLNARYTMIDMTDYEDTFSGFNEMETLPLSAIGHISILNPEPWPETSELSDYETPEVLPLSTLGKTHREM
jgi:hypothetical protein